MPSHGFYVRHVKGIQFDNIEIRTEKPDLRPAFVLDDVEDADFFRIKVPRVDVAPSSRCTACRTSESTCAME